MNNTTQILSAKVQEKIGNGMHPTSAANAAAHEATNEELIDALRSFNSERYSRMALRIERHLTGEKVAENWAEMRRNAEIAVAGLLVN